MARTELDARLDEAGESDIRPVSSLGRRALVLAGIALTLAGLWLGYAWHWEHEPRVRRVELEFEPHSAALGFVVIPPAPAPPTPAEQLEARLSAFARQVEEVRAHVDPPLVAFEADSLRAKLEQAIARIDDRAQVSVHIRDLDSNQMLFDYYGDRLLNPASNHKLLTTAAALDLLGPDYVFETRALLVDQTLYLIGEGDPTIDGEALAGFVNEVAERIPAATLGEVVIDDAAFSPRVFGPGYAEDGWGPSYMAPSGALSLNFNTVEITVYPIKGSASPAVRLEPDSAHVIVENRARFGPGEGKIEIRSVAVDGPAREQVLTRVEIEGTLPRTSRGYKVRRRVVDPGMFTGGAFARMLASASHSQTLPVRPGVAPAVDLRSLDEHGDGEHRELPRVVGHDEQGNDILLVARRRSPPLIEVVGGVLTYSNNFMAEQLLRTLGWRMTGAPGDWDNGGEVVRGYWAAIGNDPAALVFENGSGLSAAGRITTAGLVDLLAVAVRTQTAGASLFDALPVAGASGTVRARLRRSGKRVRAKSGTLNGVSGLTGVITSEAGEPQVAFSILINVRENGRMHAAGRRQLEDRIVMLVLDHIDGWEAIRGTMILDLPALSIVGE
jgi:serine-type D-Ala-D-Ala carboxypeptidase/endopeptidase (penicillin-binding protein 4)